MRLSPKAHDVLVELVRQEGRLMTKAETLSLLPTDLAPAVNLQIRMTATDDRTLSFLLLRKRDQFLEALPFVNERYDSVRDVSLRIC